MLEAIFAPRSVAVVGASPDPARLGHTVLTNMLEHGYEGAVFPIHPTAGEILGRRTYASVLAVPDPIDLAVVVIPSRQVLPVVSDFPEIVELDLNPLVVHGPGEGAVVLDARAIIQ